MLFARLPRSNDNHDIQLMLLSSGSVPKSLVCIVWLQGAPLMQSPTHE
jgi:hypothetical protein